MKKVYVTFFMLFACSLLFSCGGDDQTTPLDIYLEFRENYEGKKWSGMIKMLTDSTKKRLEKLGDGDPATGLQNKIKSEERLKDALEIPEDDIGKILECKMYRKEGSGKIGFKVIGGEYIWNIAKIKNSNKWLINIP